jgi:RNA recognition motif-containing protein
MVSHNFNSVFVGFDLNDHPDMNASQFAARPRRPIVQGPRAATQVMPPQRAPPTRPRSTNIEPSTNVFINYIPPDFSETDLRAVCSEYGKIMCSKIMINLDTGQSKCFGFVDFSTLQEAQAAIHGLNGRQIGGKRLLAKYAESREKQEHVSNMVYVKRLPVEINGEQVLEVFGKFGQILEMTPHVMESADPLFWRCVIHYASYSAAAAAVRQMNNQILAACSRPIHVRYADESRVGGIFSMAPPMVRTRSLIDEVDQRQLLPSFLFNNE